MMILSPPISMNSVASLHAELMSYGDEGLLPDGYQVLAIGRHKDITDASYRK